MLEATQDHILEDPSPPSRSRRVAPAIALGATLALGAMAVGLEAGVEDLGAKLYEPETVEPISSADFQRVLEHHLGNVVIVNLWATWCIPCVQELPELEELQRRYRERGLRVLAVSLDDLDTLEERVRPFFKERAPGLVSYLSTEDSFTFVEPLDPEWAGALPSSFFIDRRGTIRKRAVGRLTFRSFEREILPLLEDDPAP